MPIESQEVASDGGDDAVFSASISNARNVYHILKAVHFKDTCTLFATENGLKITVEDSKSLQGNAFLQSQVFQEYMLRDDSVTFKINLDILQQCLSIFGTGSSCNSGGGGMGSTTALKMLHNGYGSPLVLTLEEDGAVTDCSIKTQEPDEILDFEFMPANVISKLIVVADCLKHAFNDLDTGCDYLQILISPDKPHFRLSTSGELGQSQNDIPKDSDMVEFFECTQTQHHYYRWNLLRPTFKAINLANKVCVRVDHRGFLSLQCMIKNEGGVVCFVEYYCCPSEPDDDAEPDDEFTFLD